ncbi:ABC transporter substrate-binding protein [Spongiactinospora sp. TRM90649]|uniref:ABC transporter substrate-binding protein n=1 Tax=Spongiactinospora sp. TRM90649 TaxID=3031114 RepID=UPI0023F8A2C3|nr:ABC transporter substrate-binding protein [Spongiactinospora sp. TRM90649]MDF5758078.1 ABC transporter substrate-binding protein [Spongiactinospora sp. TRM90649]
MRTRNLSLLAISLLSFGVVSCGAGGGSAAEAGKGSLECRDGKILIGVAKAESGFASFFDVAGERGLEVAVDEINAKGGIKGCQISMISGDTKSDPAIAAEVARSLIEKGAQILVVADDFDTGVAAARVGQKTGLLTLSLAASSTVFGKAVGDLFFSGGITTTELGLAQGKYALDKRWTKTFQILDPGLAYFTEQDAAYRKIYEAGGGTVTAVERVDSLGGQSDFSSTISKIKAAKPDVVQALAVFPAVGTFVKQLRAAGVETPVVGNITLQTRELPKLVGPGQSNAIHYAAQVYFDGAGIDSAIDPAIAKFAEAYEKKFGQFPEQANAPGAYQTFMAVNEALQRKEVTDAKSAANAIRAQKGLKVPGGTLDSWKDGYAIWNPTIVGLNEGKFKRLIDYDATALRSEGA